jgi:hypothetical protein
MKAAVAAKQKAIVVRAIVRFISLKRLMSLDSSLDLNSAFRALASCRLAARAIVDEHGRCAFPRL